MKLLEPTAELEQEIALSRADPLLMEQELDVRPRFAAALEAALGKRSGPSYFRSWHEHLYALELGDLGRGLPSTATVYGFWERWEPRPPEHEIDADLAALSLWLAEATGELVPEDVGRVLSRAGVPGGWPGGSVARTPDERFADLPDFPYPPHYEEIEGLRVARIDVPGPARPEADEESEETFLLLHGEPTWSYLYRHMIPVLARAGRVVAPDLVGFGRSDKPIGTAAYSYRSHTRWLRKLVERLDLRGVTLVCQDWGGLLGLRLVAQRPERFRRVVAMNTLLPTGASPPSPAFLAWRRFSQRQSSLDVAAMMRRAVRREGFGDREAAAYAAPFPSVGHQTAALVFPRLVPVRADEIGAYDNRLTCARLQQLDLPALIQFSDQDPITGPAETEVAALFRRAEVAPRIEGAGHFLQEDCGAEIAERILEWVART